MKVLTHVSREAERDLRNFWTLLQRWNARINLIGSGSVEEGWGRHIEDSLQLAELLPSRSLRYCDLGSGGGLPAIPLAIVRRAAGFEDQVTMIEADTRKATFLRAACRELGLSAEVQAERLERAPPADADVVTARALAPLPQLLAMAERHLCCNGIAILPKGRKAHSELASARDRWSFEVEILPSRTAPEALILRIRNIDQKM